MAAPRLTLRNVLPQDVKNTLYDWLATVSEASLVHILPNNRARVAFSLIDDSDIKAWLLVTYGVGQGRAQGIVGLDWVRMCVLLCMYAHGMHRREENDMNAFQKGVAYVRENPGKVAGAALALGGATVVAPALIVGGLNVIGFSAIGPVAGSAAAWIQSTFYGGAVASGSLFALAQSAAMGGITVVGVGGQIAGVGALALGGASLTQGGDEGGNGPDEPFDPNDLQSVQTALEGDTTPTYMGPQAHNLDEWAQQQTPLGKWLQTMRLSLQNLQVPAALHPLGGYLRLGPLVCQDFEASIGSVQQGLRGAKITFDWRFFEACLRMHAAGYLRQESAGGVKQGRPFVETKE